MDYPSYKVLKMWKHSVLIKLHWRILVKYFHCAGCFKTFLYSHYGIVIYLHYIIHICSHYKKCVKICKKNLQYKGNPNITKIIATPVRNMDYWNIKYQMTRRNILMSKASFIHIWSYLKIKVIIKGILIILPIGKQISDYKK